MRGSDLTGHRAGDQGERVGQPQRISHGGLRRLARRAGSAAAARARRVGRSPRTSSPRRASARQYSRSSACTPWLPSRKAWQWSSSSTSSATARPDRITRSGGSAAVVRDVVGGGHDRLLAVRVRDLGAASGAGSGRRIGIWTGARKWTARARIMSSGTNAQRTRVTSPSSVSA